jgi:crotonobetainyl-CoA:carnitine CoA-transferase CaiB-like acyl-CoA transferase
MSAVASSPAATRPPALAGLKVVDFTIVMSGPMCTRMLADAGAEVVKIEPPDGDVVRQREPLRGGVSTYYASMNCGKKSIVLDLQTEDGKRLASELVAQADVVVENFRPGVMRRFGLDSPPCRATTRASSTPRSPASARPGRWPRRRPTRR